jgi:4-hydroxy-2-oxoheptanedioate aldolase
MVEFVGKLGYDVLFIDCEHSSTDFQLVEDLARAARAVGMESVLRPYTNEEGLLNRYLSCGVGGLQLPHVESAAEARALIKGLNRWGDGNFSEKVLVAMIESAEAIANLPDMLKISEIDAFFIGTNDLAESVGLRGNPQHPKVQSLVNEALERITDAGGAAGMNVQNDPNKVTEFLRLGVRWLAVHQRVFIKQGTTEFLRAIAEHK